jgi:hypothetical protein
VLQASIQKPASSIFSTEVKHEIIKKNATKSTKFTTKELNSRPLGGGSLEYGKTIQRNDNVCFNLNTGSGFDFHHSIHPEHK